MSQCQFSSPLVFSMASPHEFVYKIPSPTTKVEVEFKGRMTPGKIEVKLFDTDSIEWSALITFDATKIVVEVNDNSPFTGTLHVYI